MIGSNAFPREQEFKKRNQMKDLTDSDARARVFCWEGNST
jgi:hypothetical protein